MGGVGSRPAQHGVRRVDLLEQRLPVRVLVWVVVEGLRPGPNAARLLLTFPMFQLLCTSPFAIDTLGAAAGTRVGRINSSVPPDHHGGGHPHPPPPPIACQRQADEEMERTRQAARQTPDQRAVNPMLPSGKNLGVEGQTAGAGQGGPSS